MRRRTANFSSANRHGREISASTVDLLLGHLLSCARQGEFPASMGDLIKMIVALGEVQAENKYSDIARDLSLISRRIRTSSKFQ